MPKISFGQPPGLMDSEFDMSLPAPGNFTAGDQIDVDWDLVPLTAQDCIHSLTAPYFHGAYYYYYFEFFLVHPITGVEYPLNQLKQSAFLSDSIPSYQNQVIQQLTNQNSQLNELGNNYLSRLYEDSRIRQVEKILVNIKVMVSSQNEQSNGRLNVFPNPSTGTVTVKLNKDRNEKLKVQIHLVNAVGQRIATKELFSDEKCIFENLTPGIYFIESLDGFGNIQSEKLIVR